MGLTCTGVTVGDGVLGAVCTGLIVGAGLLVRFGLGDGMALGEVAGFSDTIFDITTCLALEPQAENDRKIVKIRKMCIALFISKNPPKIP